MSSRTPSPIQMSTLTTATVVTYFNTVTQAEWMKGNMEHLNNEFRTKYPAGTIVILANYETKLVFGICVLANWEGSESPCRKHHLLDQDTYTGENSKYNNIEINIADLRLLKKPMAFADICVLVGGDPLSKKTTNMWKGWQKNFSSVFGAEEAVLKRYRLWAQSLL
jgi:hypothetical protein